MHTLAIMRKHTTLDLDTDLVGQAAEALGTTRITDTVHAALADVVGRRQRAWLARYEFPDLSPESLAEMRRPRPVAADLPGEVGEPGAVDRPARRTRRAR